MLCIYCEKHRHRPIESVKKKFEWISVYRSKKKSMKVRSNGMGAAAEKRYTNYENSDNVDIDISFRCEKILKWDWMYRLCSISLFNSRSLFVSGHTNIIWQMSAIIYLFICLSQLTRVNRNDMAEIVRRMFDFVFEMKCF